MKFTILLIYFINKCLRCNYIDIANVNYDEENNMYNYDPSIILSREPIGICTIYDNIYNYDEENNMYNYNEPVFRSWQWVCEKDDNGAYYVVKKHYQNTDGNCTGDLLIEGPFCTDSTLFECEHKSPCPYVFVSTFNARFLNITSNECVIWNTTKYRDRALVIDQCYGPTNGNDEYEKYECNDTQYSLKKYSDKLCDESSVLYADTFNAGCNYVLGGIYREIICGPEIASIPDDHNGLHSQENDKWMIIEIVFIVWFTIVNIIE
eukprot:322356_1